MQRHSGSSEVTFEDLTSMWALISCIVSKDAAESGKFWAPKLDEVLDLTYKHVYRLYDELSILEQTHSIAGVDYTSQTGGNVLSHEDSLIRSLKKVDWEAVLYYTIDHLDEMGDLLPKSCLNKLKRRKKLLNVFKPTATHSDSSQIQMYLNEQDLQEHWLSRCYKHSWFGSVNDLAFSPLLSFVTIDTDIAYKLKDVSDRLDGFDGVSVPSRNTSILLVKRVSKILEDVADLLPEDSIPPIDSVCDVLKNNGYYQSDVFLVRRALYRVYTIGRSRGSVPSDNLNNVLKFVNQYMSPRNIKYLYEYPLNVFV